MRQKRKGFTLLEVSIALGLSMIIIILAYKSYSNFQYSYYNILNNKNDDILILMGSIEKQMKDKGITINDGVYDIGENKYTYRNGNIEINGEIYIKADTFIIEKVTERLYKIQINDYNVQLFLKEELSIA